MNAFEYVNPTRIVLGEGVIRRLADLVPARAKVLVTSGGGSIKRNGVRDQVLAALGQREVREFEGIEVNPDYATLMRAVEEVRRTGTDFLLAVGGGSVLDGTKFIAAAARWSRGDPWSILTGGGRGVVDAVPIGAVLTLPATGSEANAAAVISRRELGEKRVFSSQAAFPVFALLDPKTTYSLPRSQVVNGIVDAYVHVLEQYAAAGAEAPLQARQAEAILATLVEQAPAILADPPALAARATFMWCCTQALNGLIACGVPQDWATHMIGHELTALHGLDHGVTLAIVLPGALRERLAAKRARLEQYGRRVFGVGSAEAAIERTEGFFRELGMKTRLSEHGVDAAKTAAQIRHRFEASRARYGEEGDVDGPAAERILLSRA
jgi:NADP-dependent alcohol dehydrogenase